MSDKKSVRLNKLVKEFNVSIDRIYSFLESKGIEDLKLTTKVSHDVYMDLLGEFDSEKKAKLSAELLAKEKAEKIIKWHKAGEKTKLDAKNTTELANLEQEKSEEPKNKVGVIKATPGKLRGAFLQNGQIDLSQFKKPEKKKRVRNIKAKVKSKKSMNSLSGLSNLKEEFTKSENDDLLKELKNHWKVGTLRFVGRLAKNKKSGRYYFWDIRNLNGVKVLYPNNEKITISIGSLSSLEINSEYEFSVFLASEKIREKYDNKYHLVIDDNESIIPYVPGKKYVTDLLKRKEEGHLKYPENARENAELLSKNSFEINKKSETFVYELIQNADDYPNDKSCKNTEMTFRITDNFLVLAHNGSAFNKNNVRAISTIGDPDKRGQIDTIGYKGMGFKSIYKFSDHVWINSGKFSFKFEKEYWERIGRIIEDISKDDNITKKQLFKITLLRYNITSDRNKRDVWQESKIIAGNCFKDWHEKLDHNERKVLSITNRTDKNLQKLIDYEIVNVNGSDKDNNLTLSLSNIGVIWKEIILSEGFNIPWQTLPIWTNPQSTLNQIEKDLLKENVTIFIKPRGRGEALKQNLMQLEDFFNNNFKNKDRILLFLRSVNSITFYGKDSEFQSKIESEKWEISKLPSFNISNDIKTRIKEDLGSDNGDKRIPDKFGNMSSTEITFATKKEAGEIQETDNTKVFAYLPTDWNLGFDFLINGNFIPDGAREQLFHDIEWNLYLMEEAGRLFIKWISNMVTELDNSSPYKILPDINSIISQEKDDKKLVFLNRFKTGMQKGILETPFVFGVNKRLCLLNDIIIDKTGLSEVLGETILKEIFNIEKNILRKGVENRLWFDNDLSGTQVEIFDWDTLKESSTELTSILKDPITNVKFINFLISSDKMYDFKDIAFVLTKTGELEKPSNVYINITDDDLSFVSKLDVHQMNAEVKGGLSGDYESVFIPYDGYEFVKEEIISKTGFVNEMVKTVEESKELFSHLLKYYDQFNQEDKSLLTGINIYNHLLEALIIKDADLYIYNQTLQNLIEMGCFPDGHFQITSDQYSEEIYMLLENLEVKRYQPVIFIQDELCHSINEINNHILMLDDNSKLKSTQGIIELIISSRKLFSEDVEKSIFNSCKDLEVLTKDNELMPLSKCYLSYEYTENKEIEDLMEGFPQKSLSFVSPSYTSVSKYDSKEWKKTLKLLKCSDDHLSFIKKELLPSLHVLDENQIINATKLIFRHQNRLEKELISLNYFPVLTKSGIVDIHEDQVYLGKEYYQGLDSEIENLIENCLSDNIVSNKYTLNKHEDWKKFWMLIGACSEQESYEIIEDCFKYLNDNDNTIDIKFDSILSWMKARPNLSESHLPAYIQKNLVTPNLNNELCYIEQLFDYGLKDVIQNNNVVCSIDLSDDTQIIDALGLKTEIDIATYVLILKREESINWLNKNNILSNIHELTEQNEIFPEDFIANGKVMNQRRKWVNISELYSIEEEFSEKLGVKKNKFVIHEDFNKLSSALEIEELIENDFEFCPIDKQEDDSFKNILLERTKYIALIKDPKSYKDTEQQLNDKIKPIVINKCKRLSWQYNNKIKKNDFPFWGDIDKLIIYYTGDWKHVTAADMFKWIFDLFNLSGEATKRSFDRILLANDTEEIIEYLLEEGHDIPDDLNPKKELKENKEEYEGGVEDMMDDEMGENLDNEVPAEEADMVVEQEDDLEFLIEEKKQLPEKLEAIEEGKETEEEIYKVNFSDSEIKYLESVITGDIDFSSSAQKDINKNAVFRSILFLRDEGYSISENTLESFLGNNEKQFTHENGEIMNFIIRSAAKGVLFLDPSSWGKLEKADVSLLIYEGHETVTWKNNRESLIEDYTDFNKFGLVRVGNDFDFCVNDFDNLLFERDDEFENEKYDKYKLLFLLKENEQAKEFINIFSNIGGENDSK